MVRWMFSEAAFSEETFEETSGETFEAICDGVLLAQSEQSHFCDGGGSGSGYGFVAG